MAEAAESSLESGSSLLSRVVSKGNSLSNLRLSSVGCFTPGDLDFRWETRSEVVPELFCLGPMKKDLI